eukprot:SAG11_NODE_1796_length_4247_cov_5.498795_1_plen_263_part_00
MFVPFGFAGFICLLSFESFRANEFLALYEPLEGNSPALLIMTASLILSVLGWNHGNDAAQARRDAGLPSVDIRQLQQHDVANLLILPMLVVHNVAVFVGLAHPYTFTWLFSSYIAADLVYIWLLPQAVPQPSLVLAHHAAVLALLSHPLRHPQNAAFTANVAIVEINTVILIGRRQFASWLAQSSRAMAAFRTAVDAIYWSSYFAIRFGVHPWMVYVAYVTVKEPVAERFMMVLLLVMLVCFNTILLVKQIYGAWDVQAKRI